MFFINEGLKYPNLGGYLTDRDEVINKVTDIVCEMLGKEASEVKLESSFVDDLGADSLDTVELVMQLEEEFDLTIVDDDAENISTVQEAVDYILTNS